MSLTFTNFFSLLNRFSNNAALAVIMLLPFHLLAQIGINTTNPDPSSILDITATNAGVLMPRVELSGIADTATISSPATGLMVFNTSTLNGMAVGYYYWDGSEWSKVAQTSEITGGTGSNEWGTDGNNTSSNPDPFIGTTNFAPLKFKVNDTTLVTYFPNGGVQMGFGAEADSNSSFAFGKESLASGVEAQSLGSFSDASGYRSTALGYEATASGTRSFAIGASSLSSSSEAFSIGANSSASGNLSMALGKSSTASGGESTALGIESTSAGQQSIALGYRASTDGSAQYSSALGANSSATAQYANAIGANTTASGQFSLVLGEGASTSQSYAIILGNNLTANTTGATRVGIGTSTPSAKLHLDGSLRIQDGNQAAGYVLTSDANGNATWQDPSSAGVGAQYAQIYSAASTDGVNQFNPISFGTTSEINGFTANTDNIQSGSTTGTFKITYTLNLERTGGSRTMEFFLTQGYGSANKIPGSSTFINLSNQQTRTSVTKTIYLDVTGTFQQFYVFPSITDNQVRVLPSSSMSIEIIDAD